ncbi:MAG: (E)-4-hydroxy-3-methylbut-2-enyl-diphosphate synthase [Rikenellaceae bacterium]
MRFCNSYTQFKKRNSHAVKCGQVAIGEENPIVVQSMCTTSTKDTEASVAQTLRIVKNGGEIVRLTAQGVSEAENLKNIKESLKNIGINTPLVADIHFNPKAANVAALYVDKVRINPGNFVDKRATFTNYEYTLEEWNNEKDKLKAKFKEFLDVCIENDTAVRIGVNHGSLSDRIISKYGDTAKGMTVSAIEMLEMCEEFDFKRVVISMKSSNTHTMVHAYRMLCAEMAKRNMSYPLHLGVTEAGEGNDGRIRSAVGIGALLSDGIGDTIRVSLTEEPEFEIPVAIKLANYFKGRESDEQIPSFNESLYIYDEFTPRDRASVHGFGQENDVKVIQTVSEGDKFRDLMPDYVFGNNSCGIIDISSSENFIYLDCIDLNGEKIADLKEIKDKVLVLSSNFSHFLGAIRSAVFNLKEADVKLPIIVRKEYDDTELESFQLKSASDFGVLLIDSLCDGIWIEAPNISSSDVCDTAFSILQSSRARITKTEYISCPGCGRTLYSLQDTLIRIKKATTDFVGLKIAVMGCIVNGPGEMADADYGYVGSGVGVVTLYKGKEVILRNINEEEAVEKLVEFIKKDRKW